MFGKKVILLAASIMAISLWGCSTDFDAENNPTTTGSGTPVTETALVGAGNCIGCHQDATTSTAASPQVVADYLAGKHVIHSTHIDAASGDCLHCHDPFGDGSSLENLIEPGGPYDPVLDPTTYLPLAGLAAVTCETCHGGGGDHVTNTAGIPVPYKTPDYNRCGQCHNSAFFHTGFGHTQEEDNIVEDYTASKHFSGAVRNTDVCVKCHSDEGAREYRTIDTAAALTANATGLVAEANVIQCRTCHNPHNNSLLLKEATLTASAEYNTCTNCHQRHDAQIDTVGGIQQLVGTATPDGASGDLIFHAGSWDRAISSTHWDDPATSYQAALAAAGGVSSNVDQNSVIVEGYAIDPTNPRACRDCHNVHGADATINKQWASSAHGSKIRIAKESAAAQTYASTIEQVAAVRAAGANGAEHALPHYDWDDTGGWNGSARGECQKCHTATGAKNYLNAMASLNDGDPNNDVIYDPANNDFSHLVGWVDGVSSSGQNELIYCWACHSDNSGTLRNPGSLTLTYSNVAVGPTLPDIGKSNVCVNCHGGRGNMGSYGLTGDPSTTMTTLPGFGPGTQNVTETHYLVAAAMIYQDVAQTNVGYEYAGLSYADKSFYAHKRVGLNSDSPETGSGPCATCHMTDKNHSLDVVEKADTDNDPLTPDVIVKLIGTICITCHDGEHALFVAEALVGTTQDIWNGTSAVPTTVTQQMADGAAAELEHESEGFHEALSILEQELLAKGLTFTGSYPYFSGASWINEGTFGAAHNFVVLHHEPGAYAHNRFYTKRLIFDSVDWLDNGVLDGTININAATYPDAAAWFGAATTADPTAIPPIAIGDASRP